LAGPDDKAASPLSLDLVSKIVTVLDCGIEDRLEVVNQLQINAGQICMTPTQQSQ